MGDRQFELFLALQLFDGILTLINMCVLGFAIKLYSDFYKVRRLTGEEK